MTALPTGRWQEISMNFVNLPNVKHLLVILDDYSRYLNVEVASPTSAKAVIFKIDRIFSAFGTLVQVKTDNGAPFNSKDFCLFAAYLGFKHCQITRIDGHVQTTR